MNTLCFATYTKNLKLALVETMSDEELVRTLLDCILSKVSLLNKNGNPFDTSKSIASEYLSRKRPIPRAIKDSVDTVKDSATQYFADRILPLIDPIHMEDLIDAQTSLLQNDFSIAKNAKTSLLSISHSEPAVYLSKLYLFALTRPNKEKKPQDLPVAFSKKFTMEDVALINQKLALIEAPERLTPPDNVADEELRYVSELLAAYADASRRDTLTQADLSDPKLREFQKDFSKQRKNFYAAETIRRASRDSLANYGIKAFQSLKDETYAGIEETLDDYYETGFRRLKAVMERVGILTLSKSMLLKIPNWVGIEERKGICHFLVNDGKVQWVDINDRII